MPKDKTLHSTVPILFNSLALAPADVSAWTCVTTLFAGHGLSSTLHSWVFSAIAGEAPMNAIAITAATAARPIVLIDFIRFSLSRQALSSRFEDVPGNDPGRSFIL